MICPYCGNTSGNYGEVWDEQWDGEDYVNILISWWDCDECYYRVMWGDDNFEPEE